MTDELPGLSDDKIAEIEERYGVSLPDVHTYSPMDLSGPFLDEEQWVKQQRSTLHAAGVKELPVREDGCYLDDYRDAFGDDGDYRWYTERLRGAIQIGELGCGMTMWAVIVGPLRRGDPVPRCRRVYPLRAGPRRDRQPENHPHLAERPLIPGGAGRPR